MLLGLISEASWVNDQISHHYLTTIWLASGFGWSGKQSQMHAQYNKTPSKGLYDKILKWIKVIVMADFNNG